MSMSPEYAETGIELSREWVELVSDWASADEALAIFQKLSQLYNEPGRSYHSLRHISELLSLLKKVPEPPKDLTALKLAIWFHDAIYNPKRNDNEENSAKLSKQVLTPMLYEGSSLPNMVYTLIMSTQKHKPVSHSYDCRLMIDLDLSILGSSKERYQEYTRQIREEYSQYPSYIYKIGRKQQLHRFLDSTWIYHTAYFRNKYDQVARENIRWELKNL